MHKHTASRKGDNLGVHSQNISSVKYDVTYSGIQCNSQMQQTKGTYNITDTFWNFWLASKKWENNWEL